MSPALFVEAARHGRLDVLEAAVRITDDAQWRLCGPPSLTKAACVAAAGGRLDRCRAAPPLEAPSERVDDGPRASA